MPKRERVARLERAVQGEPSADWPPGHPSTWTDEELREVVDSYDPGLFDRIAAMTDEELLDAMYSLGRVRGA